MDCEPRVELTEKERKKAARESPKGLMAFSFCVFFFVEVHKKGIESLPFAPSKSFVFVHDFVCFIVFSCLVGCANPFRKHTLSLTNLGSDDPINVDRIN